MTTKVVPGTLIATPDPQTAAREAHMRIARTLRDAIVARGAATIALSGGTAPLETYSLLGRDDSVDWAKASVFWVDERAVPPTSDRSNFLHAKETLLAAGRIPPERVHRMPGEAPDLDAAARAYEATLRELVPAGAQGVPAFDVMVMGVGDDGHTASLFPGERTVEVTDRLVAAVPAAPGREARLTLTPPVIEAARSVVVIVLGAKKNEPLERIWRIDGSVRETPARVIRQARGSIAWVIDRAAGGL